MSGVGEAGLVLGLISSTIAIFEAAQEIYEAASNVAGLPKKFRVAAEQIPLVHNALSLAEQNISSTNVTNDALLSAKPVLERCKENASSVKDIFDKTIPAKDASRAERLKKAVGIKMKSRKVKEHMEEICKGIELLAQTQVFQDAEALKDIKEAIEQLNNVPDEEEQPFWVHSGAGAINANTGGGTQKNYNNSGPGSQYNAEKQFFGQIQAHDHCHMRVGDDHNVYNLHIASLASGERPETPPPPSSGVPFPRDNDFVDRGSLLKQIEEKCAKVASRVALVGIGGVGKSQLAIEYCHRLHEQSPNRWIFWVHASNAERIEQGYREIAEQVKIAGRKDPQNNIFELVARWLRNETNGKWLLVLDNADDDVVLSMPQASASKAAVSGETSQLKRPLSAYLPESANSTLVVTTRARSVANKLVEPRDVIAVEAMAETDATALLKKKMDMADIETDMEELVSILEYMPLAIVQAAAYIQQKRSRYKYTVRQYIEEFQKSDKGKTSLLNYEAGHLRRDPEAKNSIIITWQISFTYIREQWPSSADLLALMSFFDRQGIPREALTVQTLKERRDDGDTDRNDDRDEDVGIQQYGALQGSSDDDSDQFEEDIDRLQNYSFVSGGADGQTFEMHSLVQLATRTWLAMQREEERWRGEFCRKLNAVFPTGQHENWSRCELLFPHAKAAERQRPANNAYIREWGRILRNAGGYALAKGNYNEAERVCDKSARALKRAFGDNNMDTLTSIATLASIYWNQGRWTEADKLEVQVMKTRKRMLGEEHPDTLTSINNLASIYLDQGRWTEAEKLEVQVMKTRKRMLGEEHPDTLTSINNLASIYLNQGRWTEAEKLEVQLIETGKRVLGKEHPDTLTSMNNLAVTYSNQGRETEAEKLEVQVMETRKRVLGEEHPDTLTSISNLASTYRDQGRWTEAEKLEVQLIETEKRVLGEEHPDTLTSMNNLAFTLQKQGRHGEAVILMSECVRLQNRILGAEHPNTLNSLGVLAKWQGGE